MLFTKLVFFMGRGRGQHINYPNPKIWARIKKFLAEQKWSYLSLNCTRLHHLKPFFFQSSLHLKEWIQINFPYHSTSKQITPQLHSQIYLHRLLVIVTPNVDRNHRACIYGTGTHRCQNDSSAAAVILQFVQRANHLRHEVFAQAVQRLVVHLYNSNGCGILKK